MLRYLFLAIIWPLRSLLFVYLRLRARHRDLLLELNIRSDYSEAPLSHGFWAYFKPVKDRFYFLALDLASAISAVERSQLKLKKLSVVFESHSLGWAQAWEIRALLLKLGSIGVETHAYLLADDRISLFMATACKHIASPETAVFDLTAFTTESLYLQSLLSKVGVRPQFLSIGDFKSAAEIFTRKGMSPAARKQTEELIQDLSEAYFAAINDKAKAFKSADRRLTGAAQARAMQLIDSVATVTEFREAINPDEKMRTIDLHDLERLLFRRTFRLFNFRKAKRIALIVAEGNIVETATSRPGTINWPDYEDVGAALRDEAYDGAIVRVNSPGGSALISQLLWREWMLASERIAMPERSSEHVKNSDQKAKKKDSKKSKEPSPPPLPVYISQGNVAASGGYYLSAVGKRIYSTPVSITGSIGVVGGKFNVAPLLSRLGVTIDRAPKKNGAPPFSAFADFTTEHAKAIRKNMEEIYEQFLRDVALGRNVAPNDIRRHASGRVYSGNKAETLRLADQMGGLTHALTDLKEELGIKAGELVELSILPAIKESLFNRSLLPFGLARLAALADFARPGVYALETRFYSL